MIFFGPVDFGLILHVDMRRPLHEEGNGLALFRKLAQASQRLHFFFSLVIRDTVLILPTGQSAWRKTRRGIAAEGLLCAARIGQVQASVFRGGHHAQPVISE